MMYEGGGEGRSPPAPFVAVFESPNLAASLFTREASTGPPLQQDDLDSCFVAPLM